MEIRTKKEIFHLQRQVRKQERSAGIKLTGLQEELAAERVGRQNVEETGREVADMERK